MLFSGRLQGAGCKHNYKHGVMAVLPTILIIVMIEITEILKILKFLRILEIGSTVMVAGVPGGYCALPHLSSVMEWFLAKLAQNNFMGSACPR